MWAQARGGSIPLARTIGDNAYKTRLAASYCAKLSQSAIRSASISARVHFVLG